MVSAREMLAKKVLTEQEQRDRAYAYCGRWLMDTMTSDRHPILEAAGERATVADWECLEVEDPELHHQLAPLAAEMLQQAGVSMPFTPQAADIHCLDGARARRTATTEAAGLSVYPVEHTTASIA